VSRVFGLDFRKMSVLVVTLAFFLSLGLVILGRATSDILLFTDLITALPLTWSFPAPMAYTYAIYEWCVELPSFVWILVSTAFSMAIRPVRQKVITVTTNCTSSVFQRVVGWWLQPPTWKEMGGWLAAIAAVAVGYKLFRSWVEKRKSREEALQVGQRVWGAIDAVICIVAAPMVLKTGFHGVSFMCQSLRFWAGYVRSLLTGFSLLADVFGEKKDAKVAFVRAAERAADDVVQRVEAPEVEEKQRRLLKMSPAEFENYKASQSKSISALLDETGAASAASGLQIESEVRNGRRHNRWIIFLVVLIIILVAVLAYSHYIDSRSSEESVKKGQKKKKRDLKSRRYEYDEFGNRVYNSTDDEWEKGYDEARKPVCPTWQANKGVCRVEGKPCEDFFHPKEWREPCSNRNCKGPKACGKPHVARRAPQASKSVPKEDKRAKEEAQLAEPIVPLTRALGALCQIECWYREEVHKTTDAVLLFGRLWAPHHLWRDVPKDAEEGSVHFRITWADKSVVTVQGFFIKIEGLDLSYLHYPQGFGTRPSLRPANVVAGMKLVSLAMVNGELSTSNGHVTAVNDFDATHSVSTDFGHCCCALLDEFGRMVGFHVRGSTKQGTFIPLTPSVVKLMLAKN
jgi:hypothetical protein